MCCFLLLVLLSFEWLCFGVVVFGFVLACLVSFVLFFFLSVSRWSRSRVVTEAVLLLVASGTTAHHHGTTAEGRGQGVKSWAGVVSSPIPICFVPWVLFLSLQRHLTAGGLRRGQ